MGSMLSLEQAHQLIAALATIIKEESIRFFPDVQVRRAFCMAVSNKFEPLLCDASPPDRQKIKNFWMDLLLLRVPEDHRYSLWFSMANLD